MKRPKNSNRLATAAAEEEQNVLTSGVGTISTLKHSLTLFNQPPNRHNELALHSGVYWNNIQNVKIWKTD